MPRRKAKKSLKRIIDEAAEEAAKRELSVGKPVLEELEEVVWHEDEIVIYSPTMIDLPAKVYKMMAGGLKRRGFKVHRQKGVELRNDRLVDADRYIVEGEGAAEEAAICARMNNLSIVEAY
ncbi:MAG: hypothetical protein QFX35_05250 [Candidatus Verstraetearchaeota archaeon]|nr:hypothetical protein [Candidatus Verstraetearchaeota archaeon]